MDRQRPDPTQPLQDALDDAIAQLDRVRETTSVCPVDALPSASYYAAELRSLRASLEKELAAHIGAVAPRGRGSDPL